MRIYLQEVLLFTHRQMTGGWLFRKQINMVLQLNIENGKNGNRNENGKKQI